MALDPAGAARAAGGSVVRVPVWPGLYPAVLAEVITDLAQLVRGATAAAVQVVVGDRDVLVQGLPVEALTEGLAAGVAVNRVAADQLRRLAESYLESCPGLATRLGMSCSACQLRAEQAERLLISLCAITGAQLSKSRGGAGRYTASGRACACPGSVSATPGQSRPDACLAAHGGRCAADSPVSGERQ